jgi:hypothetical protein
MSHVMSDRKSMLFFAAILLLVGCSTATVTMNIDALSFISAEDRVITYGDDPVIPPFGPSVTVRTPLYRVPIAGELENITDIEAIQVALDMLMENETGSAHAEFRVFIAGKDEDPFKTEPFMSGALELSPGSSETAHFVGTGDNRVIGLFSGNEITFAAEIMFDASGTTNLTGRATMTRFDITVTGTGHANSV